VQRARVKAKRGMLRHQGVAVVVWMVVSRVWEACRRVWDAVWVVSRRGWREKGRCCWCRWWWCR
jgi:hypothetical protein